MGQPGDSGPPASGCQAHRVGTTTEEVAATPAPSSPSTPWPISHLEEKD